MFETPVTGNPVSGTYNLFLVLLSYFIVAFASYTALNLASRINDSFNLAKKMWTGGCALAMGSGIGYWNRFDHLPRSCS